MRGVIPLLFIMVLAAAAACPQPSTATAPSYTLTATLSGKLYNYTRIVVISNDEAALVAYTAAYTGISQVSLSLPSGEYTLIAVSTETPYYWSSRGNASLGYATVSLGGAADVVIDMVPVAEYSHRKVAVSVYYANGTPVENAWVSAYTPYIWIPYTEGIATHNYTRNGTAVLELYDIPYIVSAYKWLWLEISREWNETINIGGENYTMRCTCPHSIRLYGKTYIGPGETRVNITVHVAREYGPIIYPYHPVYREAGAYTGEPPEYRVQAGYTGEPGLASEPRAEPPYSQGWMQPYIEYMPIASGGGAGEENGVSVNETGGQHGSPGSTGGSSGNATAVSTPYLPVESAIILSAGIMIAAAMISLSLILIRRH